MMTNIYISMKPLWKVVQIVRYTRVLSSVSVSLSLCLCLCLCLCVVCCVVVVLVVVVVVEGGEEEKGRDSSNHLDQSFPQDCSN